LFNKYFQKKCYNIDWTDPSDLYEYTNGVKAYIDECYEEVKIYLTKYNRDTIFEEVNEEKASLDLSILLNKLSYTTTKSKDDNCERKTEKKK